MLRRLTLLIAAACLAALPAGCGADFRTNPAFPLSAVQARDILNDIEREPLALERPLLVLAGYGDPGFGAFSVAGRLRSMVTNPGNIITVTYFAEDSFDECRDRVLREVEAAFPSHDPDATIEVDVIGISMGGLVARHSGRARLDGGQALSICRLFSIGTPHRGANLARLPTLDGRQIDMRPGSSFLEDLNADPTTYDFEIIPYGRLGDGIVGVENVAPPGREPWWVPNLPLHFAHLTAASDPRILADIMKRLRGERPLTVGAVSPPPPSG